jgi:hypothetical protein
MKVACQVLFDRKYSDLRAERPYFMTLFTKNSSDKFKNCIHCFHLWTQPYNFIVGFTLDHALC